ncbi:MAG: hypothetical protein IJ147_10745 [Lachnospiraceae bacterium]|nr:hypothetical protein [Lachnospiraceae bacterium]
MAVFLVDYENVSGSNGLLGIEYLNSSDKLIIFFSQCCAKIRADQMKVIKQSGCGFSVHKLLRTSKNGLDFYIAAECGGLVQRGEKELVIVSNDKGYDAVLDYFKTNELYVENAPDMARASNIEKGILALHGVHDKKRREDIIKNVATLDLTVAYDGYKADLEYQQKIEQALQGTECADMTERVLELVCSQKNAPRKVIYIGALRSFGREQGRAVYRLVRDLVG